MAERTRIAVERGHAGTGSGNTRRDFLGKAGLIAGGAGLLGLPASRALADEPDDCTPPSSSVPAVPFTPDTSVAVNPRKSYADLTQAEVDRLKAAYAALRKLTQTDPNDPRGWLQQANVHCWYCGGGNDGASGESIHFSWWFFPWHRCYLHFHEAILGKLIGDPTLRLAYWDWASTANRTLPAAFTSPNDATNALFDANRGTTPSDALPDFLVGPSVMTNVLGAPNFDLFGGIDANSPNANGGTLENGPHGAVHIWVGSPNDLSQSMIDMGVLATAAQDPLFFAHHCNIDRLWEAWRNASTTTHLNPTSTAWLDHRWTFYDENKRLTSISVRDVLDYENSLRYSYENIAMPGQTLVEIAAPAQNITLTPEPMVVRAAELKPEVRTHLLTAHAQAQVRHHVLHIDGIEVPANRSAFVRVFVNNPQASANTPAEGPTYIGYFTVLAKTTKIAHGKKHRPINIALDVTDKIGALLQGNAGLSVTLVPVGPVAAKPASINLSFKKVYISED
jgi:polyphenol oxidase